MGALFIGGMISFVAALAIGGAAGWVTRFFGAPQKENKVFAVTFFVAWMLLAGPITITTMWAFTVDKVGINGAEADQLLAHWKVPQGAASDVCYHRSARLSEYADFQISEPDFLKWMAAQGWTPQRYTTTDEYFTTTWIFNGRSVSIGIDADPVRKLDESEPTLIYDGYCYHERYGERAESYVTIKYDVPRQRAYITAPH